MKHLTLTKQEAEHIAEQYNLGKLIKIKPFSGGFVNYNFELITAKGNYVIRVLGNKTTGVILNRLYSEFKVLTYLHEKHFPYKIPYPLKNNLGKYISKISKKTFWIYPKINGQHIKHYDNKTISQLTQAIATYHKYIVNLKIENDPKRKIYGIEKLLEKYKIMKKQKPNTLRNKIMLKNIDFLEDILHKLKRVNFSINLLPIHYDFHKDNILFENGKVNGILDFERVFYAPRILDIAQLIKCTYEKDQKKFKDRIDFIIKEYSKINPLKKEEIKLLPLILARDNCRMFELFYNLSGNNSTKSGAKENLDCLNWTIDVQKKVAKLEGWENI